MYVDSSNKKKESNMIKVFHAKEFGFIESGFVQVAEMDYDGKPSMILHHAFDKTQNIDTAWSPDGHRSTSSGDVISVMQDGKEVFFFLVPFGYPDATDTVVIDNFDIDGFVYEGKLKGVA